MMDRRKVSQGYHEHDDQTRAAALRRSPDIITPSRADVDVVWTCARDLMRMTNGTPDPPHGTPGLPIAGGALQGRPVPKRDRLFRALQGEGRGMLVAHTLKIAIVVPARLAEAALRGCRGQFWAGSAAFLPGPPAQPVLDARSPGASMQNQLKFRCRFTLRCNINIRNYTHMTIT